MFRTVFSFLFLFLLANGGLAQSFDCPSPIKQVDRNIQGDLQGQAQTLIRLGTAQLQGKFETTVVDLISKYDHSDRVAIAQNLLSTACNFLRTSKEISDNDKYEKWLQIFPLMDRYFQPDKKSKLPEPPETKGIYIVVAETFTDGPIVTQALIDEGIRFEVVKDTVRVGKTNWLYCDPHVSASAIKKIALTLLDAGIRLTRVGPADVSQTVDAVPAIRIGSDSYADDPPLSRSQILAIENCKNEYTAQQDSIKRIVTVRTTNCADRQIDFYYSYFESYFKVWSEVVSTSISDDAEIVLLNRSDEILLDENHGLYFYAETIHVLSREPLADGAVDDPINTWMGSSKDRNARRLKLKKNFNKTVYFKYQSFSDQDSDYVIDLKCVEK